MFAASFVSRIRSWWERLEGTMCSSEKDEPSWPFTETSAVTFVLQIVCFGLDGESL